MPPAIHSFDTAADMARNNPQIYYANRSDLIAGTIAASPSQNSLRTLQEQIDSQRITQLSPMHNLADIMAMLEGKLATLTELLAHWHALLDFELPPEHPDAQLPLARIDAMQASITDLLERLAEVQQR